MDAIELTDDERRVFGAVAELEAGGSPPALDDVATRSGLPVDTTRALLARLSTELGLVRQEAEGPVYGLTGRAGGRRTGEDGFDPDDVLGMLQTCLAGLPFPAGRDDIVRLAADRGAPRPLRFLLESLPERSSYLNLQELAEAVEDGER